jgi:hypothetical protein
MSTSARTMAAWIFLSALIAACGNETEIVLVVGSDIPEATMGAIGMRFNRADGTAVANPRCVQLTEVHDWPHTPVTQGMVAEGDNTESFRVTVEGYAACPSSAMPSPAIEVAASALVHFTPGERQQLGLDLSRRCLGHVCAVGQTCDPSSAACVSDTESNLPPFDPTLSTPDFSASTENFDGGPGGDASIAITELTLGQITSTFYSATPAWNGGFFVLWVSGQNLSGTVIDIDGQQLPPTVLDTIGNVNRAAVTSGDFEGTKANLVFEGRTETNQVVFIQGKSDGLFMSAIALPLTYHPLYAGFESEKSAFRLLLDGSTAGAPALSTSIWASSGGDTVTTLAMTAVENPVLATGPSDALVLWQLSSTAVQNAYIDDTAAPTTYTTTQLPPSDVRPAATSVLGTPAKYLVLVDAPVGAGTDELSVVELSYANQALTVSSPSTAGESVVGVGSLAIASGKKSALCAVAQTAGGLLLARYGYATGLAQSVNVLPGDTTVRSAVQLVYDPFSETYLVLSLLPNGTLRAFVYPDQ